MVALQTKILIIKASLQLSRGAWSCSVELSGLSLDVNLMWIGIHLITVSKLPEWQYTTNII